MTPEEALLRVLTLTGLSFPRGVLGPETWALARALVGRRRLRGRPGRARRPPPRPRTGRCCGGRWRPPCCGPRRRPPPRTPRPSRSSWVGGRRRPGHARSRAPSRCARPPSSRPRACAPASGCAPRRPAVAEGGPAAAIAAAQRRRSDRRRPARPRPRGLRPRDRGLRGGRAAAPRTSTRSRAPAATPRSAPGRARPSRPPRSRGAPQAEEAVRVLASGPPPQDPAEDLIWVPTILSLMEEGIERALVVDEPE